MYQWILTELAPKVQNVCPRNTCHPPSLTMSEAVISWLGDWQQHDAPHCPVMSMLYRAMLMPEDLVTPLCPMISMLYRAMLVPVEFGAPHCPVMPMLYRALLVPVDLDTPVCPMVPMLYRAILVPVDLSSHHHSVAFLKLLHPSLE